jgi:hypothetical protein
VKNRILLNLLGISLISAGLFFSLVAVSHATNDDPGVTECIAESGA